MVQIPQTSIKQKSNDNLQSLIIVTEHFGQTVFPLWETTSLE